MPEATAERNCPFYGRHMAITLLGGGTIPRQGVHFVDSGGNQCALEIRSHHPCELAVQGEPVDWRVCWVWLQVALDPERL